MEQKRILMIGLIIVQVIKVSPYTKSANSINTIVPSSGTIGGSEITEPPPISENPPIYLPIEKDDYFSVYEDIAEDSTVSNNSGAVQTGDEFNRNVYFILLLLSAIVLLFLFRSKTSTKREAKEG